MEHCWPINKSYLALNTSIPVFLSDGTRVAASTSIDLLLLDDFKLVINDLSYHVRPPKRGNSFMQLGYISRSYLNETHPSTN